MSSDGKRERFVILDALRGLAGLCVLLFHISEPYYASGGVQVCGHGYLAVEFFLLLMGYMLGYAYDGRWQGGMTTFDFFKVRLKRLHPLVISGTFIGLALVLLGFATDQRFLAGSFLSLGRSGTGVAETVGVALVAATMVPIIGFGCLNPFNACTWTLYYEYLGNILYAVGVRKLGVRALAVGALVTGALSAAYVFHFNLNDVFATQWDVFDKAAVQAKFTLVGGWCASEDHVLAGCVRMLFPLFYGLLLARLNWRIRLPEKRAMAVFWVCVAVFAAMLFMPHPYALGKPGHPWVNGAFELLALGVVFPLLLLTGAGNAIPGGKVARASVFVAELSYPIYMTHYPFMRIHNWWVGTHSAEYSTLACVLIGIVEYLVLAFAGYLAMRFWDKPFQQRFGKRMTGVLLVLLAVGAALWWRGENARHRVPETQGGWTKAGIAFGLDAGCRVIDATPAAGVTKPYALYCSLRDQRSIALVESDDGKTWSAPVTLLEPDGSRGETRVSRPCVVRDGGVWRMWYAAETSSGAAIALAESKDGLRYVRVGTKPVLAAGVGWDGAGVTDPCVARDAARGTWRMWYTGLPDGNGGSAIGYAESADGVTWTRDARNPVLTAGRDAWEGAGVEAGDVQALEGGRLALYYTGRGTGSREGRSAIGVAESADGLRWTRGADNPILIGRGWERGSVNAPAVFFDAARKGWRLFYHAAWLAGAADLSEI